MRVRSLAATALAGTLAVLAPGCGPAATPIPGAPACRPSPADSFWRSDVRGLPVHPSSPTWIATAGATRALKADFGSGLWDGGPIGIPYNVVGADQAKVAVAFDYDDESDRPPGGYPVPADPAIEGGPASDGDRHVLTIDRDSCTLYELWSAYPNGDGTWRAGSGAVFDLRANAMRPAGWTSSDAAGLPVFPGLVRWDEVTGAGVHHAIRMTVPRTAGAFVWPASHRAGTASVTTTMPMGTWLRLKPTVDVTAFDPYVRPILAALQTHGAVIADNGSAWYLSGAPDERWDNDRLATLGRIKGTDFEVVDASSEQVAPDSYQARSAR
jgi:hypothetical protein